MSLRLRALLTLTALLPAAIASARPVNLDRTVFVTPVAGNPVASGNRLLAAVADITTASATNPWLVKIEPGLYDLDGRSLALKPYVDVEGSGEGVTTVRSTVNADGTIQGADHAELRSLTVVNTGATVAIALVNEAPLFRAAGVTCLASGGSSGNTGLANFADGGAFVDLSARAEGGNATGISSDGGLLSRVRAFASGTNFAFGIFNAASTGELVDVVAEAQGASYAVGIRNEAGGPLLRGVRASGNGGNIGEGIVNGGGSAARIRGAVVTAVGGATFASGIRNEFSSASVSDATITVSAASSAFGVTSSFSGAPEVRNSTIRVTAGGQGVGVRSFDTQTVVEGSTIVADGASLRNDPTGSPATSISVGASRLQGPVDAGTGVLRCAASYDGAFTPLGAACVP